MALTIVGLISVFSVQIVAAGESTPDLRAILQTRCTACHRTDGPAPFSLTSDTQIRRHARAIRASIGSGQMPPWKPHNDAPPIIGDRRLTDAERTLLLQEDYDTLLAASAPVIRQVSATEPSSEDTRWLLGKPDLVLEMDRAATIPADGPDQYRYVVLHNPLPEAKWISAIEFKPGNPRVVHHASFMTDVHGIAKKLDAASPEVGYLRKNGSGFGAETTLGGWAPGVIPQPLPRGTARLLPANCDVVFQMHYHPVGKESEDRSRIGFYFSKELRPKPIIEIPIADMRLKIKAGNRRHVHEAEYVVPVDLDVIGVSPHAHFLAKTVRAVAAFPDGRKQTLIRIDDWDFSWQQSYLYAKPLTLPGGTIVNVTWTYDNSAENPRNPHRPPKDIRWGEDSTDEMGVVFLDVLPHLSEQAQLLRLERDMTFREMMR